MNKEQRWEQGTYSPAEIEQLIEGDHDAQTWKLINTLTNLQSIADGLDALCTQQARQLEGYKELHEIDVRGANGEKTDFDVMLRAADKAGLLTDSMRAEWLSEAQKG